MRILGIETSCDDTGIAIYDENLGLIANQLHTQTQIHRNYGGIVPELAARNHLIYIVPLIKKALKESRSKFCDLSAIAYTAGPGLAGSLMIGSSVGSSLAYALNKPIVAVNHMEAHLLSFGIGKNLKEVKKKFPFIGLLVSGGNTQLVKAKSLGKYEVIGETKDDAAGEVIDKVAKMLGLTYPGGVSLSLLAEKSNGIEKIIFPRPMTKITGLDFSFSGLKTSVFNAIRKDKFSSEDIAKAFQDALVDTLVIKCERAMCYNNLFNLVIAGGVSANVLLRNKLLLLASNLNGSVSFVDSDFCTDNGAMVAFVGLLRLKANKSILPQTYFFPNWKISDVSSFTY
ncbi:tRNA N6-adenosine threonylcarbamoyltransferase [Buchnera aphidicola (Thelaxes suberi)]|uniref:tRNA (adenosine(37)-N6)-threonylcarbamoyltransferase complex transferase subunit TsaD n=1 Tax=Buchnera aphidicola TaxID=9 RepID=UPI003463E49A